MAQNHLDGFLADVTAINPGFRQNTSSLRGLIEFLERTVQTPNPMNAQGALVLCSGGPGLNKYRPAVERLVSVWGQGGVRPYPRAPEGNSVAAVDINRICFRGDDRPPASIFNDGFYKRSLGAKPVYRVGKVETPMGEKHDRMRTPISGTSRAGDLNPDTAVCFTPSMHVASLFPIPTNAGNMENTWLYIVHVTSGYDTNGRQVLDALKGLSQLHEFEMQADQGNWIENAALNRFRVGDIMQNLYGRELATDVILPSRILAAIKIKRSWNKVKYIRDISDIHNPVRIPNGADYVSGGQYTVTECVMNEQAVYPNSALFKVVDELIEELEDNKPTFAIPTSEDGFKASDSV